LPTSSSRAWGRNGASHDAIATASGPRGESLREALLDAGIVRLRPVLITVGATVLALFPLALPGGPLWEPMCYAQIGGLTVATFVTTHLGARVVRDFRGGFEDREMGEGRESLSTMLLEHFAT